MVVGKFYSNARLDLMYPIQTEVQMTNPSEELHKVHHIEPKRYLILPRTKIVFPDDIPHFPTLHLTDTHSRLHEIAYHYAIPNDASVSAIVPVELKYGILDVLRELGKGKIDTINVLSFKKPNELEKKISDAKREFLRQLQRIEQFEQEGIVFVESGITTRIVADYSD